MSNSDWHSEETFKSLMLYGNNALRFVLLVNGGAVIALLTFLGNILKNETTSIHMAMPMGCFLLGITVGGLANITAYMTQLRLYNESIGNSQNTRHTKWLYGSLVLIVFGILLFFAGAVLTLLELQSYTLQGV